jgi:hypothetical protein
MDQSNLVASHPDVIRLCADALNLVAVVRMGLEPNDEDLSRASAAVAAILALTQH